MRPLLRQRPHPYAVRLRWRMVRAAPSCSLKMIRVIAHSSRRVTAARSLNCSIGERWVNGESRFRPRRCRYGRNSFTMSSCASFQDRLLFGLAPYRAPARCSHFGRHRCHPYLFG